MYVKESHKLKLVTLSKQLLRSTTESICYDQPQTKYLYAKIKVNYAKVELIV